MREIAVAILSACVAGAGTGKALSIGSGATDQNTEPTALLSEDPGMALHRAVMGAEPWTAPPPVIRVTAPPAPLAPPVDFQEAAFRDDEEDLVPAPAPVATVAAAHPVQIAQALPSVQKFGTLPPLPPLPPVTTDAAEGASAQADRSSVPDTASDTSAN